MIDYYNINNSLEAGYFSGYWPYAGGRTNNLVPYFTIGNGKAGAMDAPSNPIGANQAISMIAKVSGSGSAATVGGVSWNGIAYSVSTPRWNFMQGEVTASTKTWMGGGSGENFFGYWIDSSGATHAWGFHNDCQNSPYWVYSGGASLWSNGGS